MEMNLKSLGILRLEFASRIHWGCGIHESSQITGSWASLKSGQLQIFSCFTHCKVIIVQTGPSLLHSYTWSPVQLQAWTSEESIQYHKQWCYQIQKFYVFIYLRVLYVVRIFFKTTNYRVHFLSKHWLRTRFSYFPTWITEHNKTIICLRHSVVRK